MDRCGSLETDSAACGSAILNVNRLGSLERPIFVHNLHQSKADQPRNSNLPPKFYFYVPDHDNGEHGTDEIC